MSPDVSASSQVLSALARFGGSGAPIRNASIRATIALSGKPRRLAASSSAVQNAGSRLIELW